MYSLAIASHRALNYDGGGRYKPRLSLVPLPPDQINKSKEFKRWLALFFIEKGRYKITDKGYRELAPQIVRSDTHFREGTPAKERSTKVEITRPLTKSEIKEAVARKVEEMLREGKAEELYNKGYLIHKSNWQLKETRITVIKKLLEFLERKPTEIIANDFNNNGLGGLLVRREYKSSPYLALVEAGYAYSLDEIKEQNGEFKTSKLYPWELFAPMKLYENEKNRTSATKWLVWKLNKDPKEINGDDFHNNGLGGLLKHYKNSPYLALVEAGYAYSIDEIKEHARKMQFGTDKIYPWEMVSAPHGFYEKTENRIAVTKWLVWKLNKEPKEIAQDDFNNNGLSGLISHHYKGSPYLALLEASLVTPADETYMRERGYFGNR